MRYWIGLVVAVAPAQEGSPSGLRRWHPDVCVDPATGGTFAQQRESDFEIEYVAQPPKRSSEQIRVQRAKIGVGVSVVPIVVGGVIVLAEAGSHVVPFSPGSEQAASNSTVYAGVAVAAAGVVSMIANGAVLAKRKRTLRESEKIAGRKVRWDRARSRLMF